MSSIRWSITLPERGLCEGSMSTCFCVCVCRMPAHSSISECTYADLVRSRPTSDKFGPESVNCDKTWVIRSRVPPSSVKIGPHVLIAGRTHRGCTAGRGADALTSRRYLRCVWIVSSRRPGQTAPRFWKEATSFKLGPPGRRKDEYGRVSWGSSGDGC